MMLNDDEPEMEMETMRVEQEDIAAQLEDALESVGSRRDEANSNEVRAALDAQARVWRLLSTLLLRPSAESTSTIASPQLDTVASDATAGEVSIDHRAAVTRFRETTPALNKLHAVVRWAQLEARDERDERGSGNKWDWNLPSTYYTSMMNTSAILDPDAVSRDAVRNAWAPQDVEQAHAFDRRLFEHVRLFGHDQIDQVVELCSSFGAMYKAVSVSTGAMLWRFGSTPSTMMGNRHRWLWKYACLNLAHDATASIWERALYAWLAGEAATVANVCESWEDYCWAYCSCAATRLEDALLLDAIRCSGAPLPELPFDVDAIATVVKDVSVSSVIDEFERAYFGRFERKTKSAYERIAKYAILGDIDAIFDELLRCLDEDPKVSARRCFDLASFHEFAARLYVLLSDNTQQPRNQAHTRIMLAFIGQMVSVHDLQPLVPHYVQFLPDEHKVEVYSEFLLRYADNSELRSHFLSLAQQLYSPHIVKSIRQRVLQLVVPSSEALPQFDWLSDSTMLLDPEIMKPRDPQRLRPIHDLINCQDLDHDAAIVQANYFYRALVHRDDFEAVELLYKSFIMPTDTSTPSRREYAAWHDLVSARLRLQEIERFFAKRPQKPDDVTASEKDMDAFAAQLRPWRVLLDRQWPGVHRAVAKVLSHPGGWLRESMESNVLDELRRTCIPDLVLRFLDATVRMEQGAHGLAIAQILVDAEFRNYEVFQPEQLAQALRLEAHNYLLYAEDTNLS